MKIIIYDDCIEDVNHLKRLLADFFNKMSVDYSVEICKSTEYLFTHIDEFDFLFLDIEINDENGIEIGKRLLKIRHNCRVIITSRYKKYLIDGYRIRADQYFLKPIQEVVFNTEMEDELYLFQIKYSGFYDENLSKTKILYTDILYVDVYDRKTRIHFKNGKILATRYTLKEWEEKLDLTIFEKVHKAYIVNLFYISVYSNQDISLMNGENIPLSRNMKKHFEEKYIALLPRIVS